MVTRWFTSDFHLGHTNILKYCPWNRPWETVEEMNQHLVSAWNNSVRLEDEVYFLGDMAMNFKFVEEFLPQLNGRIVFCLGNHDNAHPIHKKKTEQTKEKMFKLNPNLVDICTEKTIMIGKYRVLLSHFPWYSYPAEEDGYEARYSEWRPRREKYPGIQFLLHGHKHSRPEGALTARALDVGFDPHGALLNEEEIEAIIKEQLG